MDGNATKHVAEYAAAKDSLKNKWAILTALPGALLRCPPLAVLALRRVGRLASHPARAAQMTHLFLNES